MKGLLLKDAYQIWHYAKGVIVAAVVMMGAGVVTIMNGANFFCRLMIDNALIGGSVEKE